jgi:hypothetical protein
LECFDDSISWGVRGLCEVFVLEIHCV